MIKRVIFTLLILIIFSLNFAYAQSTQEITLKPGFNFICFTNLLTLTPIQFKNLNTSINDIYFFSASAGSFLSDSEGTLTSLSAGKGYIIKNISNSDIKINISGTSLSAISPSNLKTGFNLVGFSTSPPNLTFEKLMSDNSIIKGCYKWSPTAGSFIQVLRDELNVINKIDGVNPIIKAGESYFINVYNDTQIIYDNSTVSLNPSIWLLPVATPVISPNNSLFSSSQQVTIICATPEATIKYTTDGTIPSETNGIIASSTLPITLLESTTIKAIALKTGMSNSAFANATFTKAAQVNTPIISPSTGTYINYKDITINCATTGAEIFYTLDNTEPTIASTKYTGTFAITSTKTIKAIAIKSGMVDSEISSANIIIDVFNANISSERALRKSNGDIEVSWNTDISISNPAIVVIMKYQPDGDRAPEPSDLQTRETITYAITNHKVTFYSYLTEVQNIQNYYAIRIVYIGTGINKEITTNNIANE